VRIAAADVVVTCPGRNFVTLRVTTEDGLVGLGDATLNGRELAVASYLADHVVPLLHDGHHRMTPIEAARLGKALEPYDLFWLEDATPGEDQAALRLIRQHTTTPLAIGEVFNSVHDYTTLLGERLIDYVRSAVTHTGGVTAMKKLLDYAAVHGARSGLHGPTDISPVGMAAALHLDLAVHNFGIQEYMPHTARTLEVFRTPYTFTAGLLHPSDAPGLGVELDLDAAARFPYRAAYLPVNRLADGTLHDW